MLQNTIPFLKLMPLQLDFDKGKEQKQADQEKNLCFFL